jgi:HEAT repeat protein
MARSTSWMPLALGVVLVIAVVALARFGGARVNEGLLGVARQIPTPPDRELPGVSEAELAGLAGGEPTSNPDTGAGPRVDLEYPTEADWLFLERTLRDGEPDARRSAAKALVVMGRMRSSQLLFEASRRPADDADLYCLAALDVLRLQRWEDALPALLEVMLDDGGVSESCRSEASDRFAVAGGRDVERLATLATHDDPAVRGFVASYLLDVDPHGQAEVLAALAADPDPLVRARAGAAPAAAEEPDVEE